MMGTSPYPPLPIPATQSLVRLLTYIHILLKHRTTYILQTQTQTQTDTSIYTTETPYYIFILHTYDTETPEVSLQKNAESPRKAFSSGTCWDNHSSHCLLQLGVILKLLPLHAFSFGKPDLYLCSQQSISALSWYHLYFQVCSWLVFMPESTPFTDNKRKSYSAT